MNNGTIRQRPQAPQRRPYVEVRAGRIRLMLVCLAILVVCAIILAATGA
jgi:hypothetical protein